MLGLHAFELSWTPFCFPGLERETILGPSITLWLNIYLHICEGFVTLSLCWRKKMLITGVAKMLECKSRLDWHAATMKAEDA